MHLAVHLAETLTSSPSGPTSLPGVKPQEAGHHGRSSTSSELCRRSPRESPVMLGQNNRPSWYACECRADLVPSDLVVNPSILRSLCMRARSGDLPTTIALAELRIFCTV